MLLVRRANDGCQLSFAALLARHADIIGRRCTMYRFPGAGPDDVRQEALAAFTRAIATYRPDRGPLRSFIAMVVGRALASRLRESRRHKHAVLTDAISLDGPAALNADDDDMTLGEMVPCPRREPPDELAERQAAARAAAVILADLSDLERRALLGVLSGRRYAELGERKSIDNAVQRARSRVRRVLIEEGHVDLAA